MTRLLNNSPHSTWNLLQLFITIITAIAVQGQEFAHLLSDTGITTAILLSTCDTSTIAIYDSTHSPLPATLTPVDNRHCLLQTKKYHTTLQLITTDTQMEFRCTHSHQLLSDLLIVPDTARAPRLVYFETKGPSSITIIHYLSASTTLSLSQKLICNNTICQWTVSPSPAQYAITVIVQKNNTQEIRERTFDITCLDAIAGKNPHTIKTLAEATLYFLPSREARKLQNLIKEGNIAQLTNKLKDIWATKTTCDKFIQFADRTFTAQRLFGSLNTPGHLSDRGRVYILYGAPNHILASSLEPGTLPYEIWHYYYLNGQPDVKFVFYNPEIAGTNYILIHSNLRGEINNPRWEDFVRQNFKSPEYTPAHPRTTPPHWGERLPTYYRDY